MICNDLKDLIEKMLDKNPETRITIPKIKVIKKTDSEYFPNLCHFLKVEVILYIVTAPSVGDGGWHQPSSSGGGALHGSGGDRGGGAEQRQTHHQPLHCGELQVTPSLETNSNFTSQRTKRFNTVLLIIMH